MNTRPWIAALAAIVCAANVQACPAAGDQAAFLKFRDSFINKSRLGKADQVVNFYNFPARGGGVQQSDREIKLSKKTFLSHYEVLFVKNSVNGTTRLFKDLQATKDIDPSVLAGKVLADGCFNDAVLKYGIGEHNYTYRLSDGQWKVSLVDFSEDYDDVVYELTSRGIKPW